MAVRSNSSVVLVADSDIERYISENLRIERTLFARGNAAAVSNNIYPCLSLISILNALLFPQKSLIVAHSAANQARCYVL